MKRRNFFQVLLIATITPKIGYEVLKQVEPIQRPYFFISKLKAVTASTHGITVKSKTTPFGTFHYIEHPYFTHLKNVRGTILEIENGRSLPPKSEATNK